MAEDRVTIEPEFGPRSVPKEDRGRALGWMGAVAMAIAAFVFGALISLPTPADDEFAAAAPQVPTPGEDGFDRPAGNESRVATPRAEEPPTAPDQPLGELGVPLREMVPGFTDTIMMLTTPTESFNIIRWRASLPTTEVVLSLDRNVVGEGEGWPLGLDASGYRFAQVVSEHIVRVHGIPSGSVAWQGGNIGEGLVAAIWHDTEPSRLAQLECTDPHEAETAPAGTVALVSTDFSAEPHEPPTVLPLEHDCTRMWLDRWGAWGALLISDDASLLVDAAGSVVETDPEALMLAAGPGGATLWTMPDPQDRGEALAVRSADGELRVMISDLEDDAVPSQASWSPDGAHIALSVGSGWTDSSNAELRVVDVATGAVVAEVAEAGASVIAMAWSSEGRFLIYELWRHEPESGALVFYDTATNTTTMVPISEIVDEVRVHSPYIMVVPGFDAITKAGLDAGGVSPSSVRMAMPPVGDDASLDIVSVRLPLGAFTTPPNNPRLDFLNTECDAYCFRDAAMINPDEEQQASGTWLTGEPFHVRHGFTNEGTEPLGEDFTVELTVTRREGPAADDINYPLDHTYRFSPDYVLRGTVPQCGPGYRDQTEPQTCEWFVHDFPEGLPTGRYDIWAEWFAPCSAWLDLGFADSCPDPDEVTTNFAGSVNMPFYGEDYEGEAPEFVDR